MKLIKKKKLKMFLLLAAAFILSLSVIPVTADAAFTGEVNLQTYGVLPCTILNLTPFNIYATFSSDNYNPNIPMVMGGNGVFFPKVGETNIYGLAEVNGQYPTVLPTYLASGKKASSNSASFIVFPSMGASSSSIPYCEFAPITANNLTTGISGTGRNSGPFAIEPNFSTAWPTSDGRNAKPNGAGAGTINAGGGNQNNNFHLNLYLDLNSGGDPNAKPLAFNSLQPIAGTDFMKFVVQVYSQGVTQSPSAPQVGGSVHETIADYFEQAFCDSLDNVYDDTNAAFIAEVGNSFHWGDDPLTEGNNYPYNVAFGTLAAGVNQTTSAGYAVGAADGAVAVWTGVQPNSGSMASYGCYTAGHNTPVNYFLDNEVILINTQMPDATTSGYNAPANLRIIVTNSTFSAAYCLARITAGNIQSVHDETIKLRKALMLINESSPKELRDFVSNFKFAGRQKYAHMSPAEKSIQNKNWLKMAKSLLAPLQAKYPELKELKLMQVSI